MNTRLRIALLGFMLVAVPAFGQTRPRVPLKLRADVGFRPYVQLGYGWLAAGQSFDALLGRSAGPWLGGGGTYGLANGLFVQGGVDVFRRTGQRVFVQDGQVFQLGTPDTVTMIPVAATAGYRLRVRGATPYVGGGVGRYLYRESLPSADPSENVSRQTTSYHVLGGIELRVAERIGGALEVQYTHVPNELAGGVGDAFNEHDLGSVQMRIKLLLGR